MIPFTARVALASLIAVSTPVLAGHSNLTVPAADTFLLGGDQDEAITVSGRNTGSTRVAIIARVGISDTKVAEVAPGEKFAHVFAVGQIAAIANLSKDKAARLSVDFTGDPSGLSMRYVLPQKD